MRYAIVLFFVLCACSPEKSVTALPGAEESKREVFDGASTNPSLLSYHKFLFAKPLRGINSSEHFILEARFVQDGAKMIFHNHFMGFDKRDGVELSFERRDLDLIVSLSAPDRVAVSLGKIEGVFTNGNYIRLRIEMHDGVSTGTHTLVWLNDLNSGDARQLPLDTLTRATAVIDSEKSGFVSVASGRGIFAGVELWAVDLISARRDLPYVVD